MMRYMVVVERGATSWGAHVPDLPGCIAVGANFDELLESLRDSIRLYLGEGTAHGSDPADWPVKLAGMAMIGGRCSITIEIPDRAATAICVGVRVSDYPGT